jgi:hypothetical protein
MKIKAIVAVLALGLATSAMAGEEYNTVPAGDAQYKQCLSYANKHYDGGGEASLIKGQNKAQAWCTCMWNETPEDFAGNLVKYSESSKGAKTNKICEKYSGWSE